MADKNAAKPSFRKKFVTERDRAPLNSNAYCLIRLHSFSNATRLIYAIENSLAFHSYRHLVVIAAPYQDDISHILGSKSARFARALTFLAPAECFLWLPYSISDGHLNSA